MCKLLGNSSIVIKRYINPEDHHPPEPTGSEDGGIFTPYSQQFDNGVVTCSFSLSNFTAENFEDPEVLPPLSQSTKYHPIFAVGLLHEDGK